MPDDRIETTLADGNESGTPGLLKSLPSVSDLLKLDPVAELLTVFEHGLTVDALREVLEDARKQILKGEIKTVPTGEDIARSASSLLEKRFKPSLVRVVNVSGTIIHTNLGQCHRF